MNEWYKYDLLGDLYLTTKEKKRNEKKVMKK